MLMFGSTCALLHTSMVGQRVLHCVVQQTARALEWEKTPMRALWIVLVVFAVTHMTARAEVTYAITSYPAGLADLPCDAFTRNSDGSWTQVATLLAGGALIPFGNRFKDTAETRIIEKKCSK